MAKKYQLDRKRFIMYYSDTLRFKKLIHSSIIAKDLIKGSEFVITAQDVLDSLETIPGCLVNVTGRVASSDCELVYT